MAAMAGTGQVFGDRRQWLRNLAVALACGLFLGAVGPFGSYLNPSRLTVIAYWVGAVLLGEAMIGALVRPAALLAPRWGVRPFTAVAAMTLVMAVPLSLICHAMATALWPDAVGRIGRLAWYGQTLVIAAGLAAAHQAATLYRPAQPAPARAALPPGDFLSRLPPSLGRDLIALQMEDHYVRAHTALGSALILIPLRQALEELAHVPGLKVHRSWWVARHAVRSTVQDGRNMRLQLVNGLVAPVSRAHVAVVRGVEEGRKEAVLF
jgi:DNA-binding LytR/AlgR family response regulator